MMIDAHLHSRSLAVLPPDGTMIAAIGAGSIFDSSESKPSMIRGATWISEECDYSIRKGRSLYEAKYEFQRV